MNNDKNAHRSLSDTFRTELAKIQAGARNGGVVSPRRYNGLLVEYERVKKRYDTKIMNLRAHETSQTIDDVESEIRKIAAEFSAKLATSNAA